MEYGRRMALRVPAITRVDWRLKGSCTHHVCTTKDWSRGGIFIQTVQPRAPGEVLSILMRLGAEVVQVEGTVVHKGKGGMGVRLDLTGARVK